jgi:uncharacterized membrane protein
MDKMKMQISFQKILLGFFAFIGIMILVRYMVSGERRFVFLIWNLFLAWIPFILSEQFKLMHKKKWWQQMLIFFMWFIFLPNALYIVTDLIHLDAPSTVPKWYDATLLFTAATVSLIMAFISLIRAEGFLLYRFNGRVVNGIMLVVLFFGSFGVYLGRFLRWNSWDIISKPAGLFFSVAERFLFPLHHLHTWGITILYTILFYRLYLAVKKMPGYMSRAN